MRKGNTLKTGLAFLAGVNGFFSCCDDDDAKPGNGDKPLSSDELKCVKISEIVDYVNSSKADIVPISIGV